MGFVMIPAAGKRTVFGETPGVYRGDKSAARRSATTDKRSFVYGVICE